MDFPGYTRPPPRVTLWAEYSVLISSVEIMSRLRRAVVIPEIELVYSLTLQARETIFQNGHRSTTYGFALVYVLAQRRFILYLVNPLHNTGFNLVAKHLNSWYGTCPDAAGVNMVCERATKELYATHKGHIPFAFDSSYQYTPRKLSPICPRARI